MYDGSGVAVAVPDEKLCPRTLVLLQFGVLGNCGYASCLRTQSRPGYSTVLHKNNNYSPPNLPDLTAPFPA